MRHKTIAEYMVDVLVETGNDGVMFGDTRLLDECARRCVHTNLMELHPLDRHYRILNACEKSALKCFRKECVHIKGHSGNPWWRSLRLMGVPTTPKIKKEEK